MKIKCFYRSSLDGICSGAIYDMSINRSNYDSIDFIPVSLDGSIVLDEIDSSTTVLFLGVFLTKGQLDSVRTMAGLVIYINNLDCNYAIDFDGSRLIGKVDYATSLPEVVWSFFNTDVVPVPVWLLGSYFIQRDLSDFYYYWNDEKHDDVYRDLCVPFYYYAQSLNAEPDCNSWSTLFERGWRTNFMTLGIGYLSRLVGYAEVGFSIMYYPGASDWVKSVNGKRGDVTLTKQDLGLGRVDNTSDLDKPVSNSVQALVDQLSNSLNQSLSDLQDTVQGLVGDVESLTTGLSSVEGSIGSFEEALSDLTDRVEALESSLSGLSGKVDTVETSLEGLSSRLESSESDITELQSKVSALESN